MDGGNEYEEETVTYGIGGYEEEVEHDSKSSSSSHSEHRSDRTLSSSPHNGHPQCPSSAGASDDTGRPSIDP